MVSRVEIESDSLRCFCQVARVLLVLLCLVSVVGAEPTPSAKTKQAIHTYDLMSGIRSVVLDDGSVEFHYEASGITHLLLEVGLAGQNVPRGSEATLFTGLYAEGVAGGQRGFAREADDDSDGLLDEDRADGRDNDGDGRLDEDFMAVSDAMVVVNRTVAGRRLHLETYHWNYSHLRSGLSLYFNHTDAADLDRDGIVSLRLPAAIWHQAELPLPGRAGARDASMRQDVFYVASLPHPVDPEGRLWLGVYPLSRGGRGQPAGSARRVQLADNRLDIPLHLGEVELAISLAPSILQLRCSLAQLRAVHRGVPDMTGQGRVAWIVPPSSLGYRGTTAPAVRWTPFDPDGFRLVFSVQPGDNALFDPDRFVLDDTPLGPPTAIIWRSQDEQGLAEFVHPWSDWTVTDLEKLTAAEQDPYRLCSELQEFAGAGDLIFEFAEKPEASTGSMSAQLVGQTLCGRSFEAKLAAWIVPESRPAELETGNVAEGTETSDAMSRLRAANRIPTLNPELLENYPNPFQVQTSIKFAVPETVEEGFVWEEGIQPSLPLDSRIPYTSGQPVVTLKVYSLGGKEIATLFSGSLGTGEYHASWDGTDAWGRTVASGTYFCKL